MWIFSQRASVQVDCLVVLMVPLVSKALFEEMLCAGWRPSRVPHRVRFPIGHHLVKRPKELYRELHREHAKVVGFSSDTVGLEDLPRFYFDHASRQSCLITDDRVRTEDEIFRT